MKIYIESVGLAASGIENWQEAQTVLQGADYEYAEMEKYKPSSLPPNERRRATKLVRLAFKATEDAVNCSHADASQMATVFSSSGGDYHIIDQICRSLSKPERAVSPTQFHNSVHNSAAGYWSIGIKSEAASSSIAAYDYSFAMGLLEAAANVYIEGTTTLLSVYELCPPEPLDQKRQVSADFAVSMILSATESSNSIACIELSSVDATDRQISKPDNHSLIDLFERNPVAKSLNLLEALSLQQEKSCYLPLAKDLMLEAIVSPSNNSKA